MEIKTDNQTNNFKLKKCSGCGGDLVFDIDTNSLWCSHCDSRYPVKNIPFTFKTGFEPGKIEAENIDNQSVTIKCNSCGATMVVDSDSMSAICPFCSSSKIINVTTTLHTPEAIIPFSVKKEAIAPIFAKWVKKRKFVKKGFKKLAVFDNAKPVYTPVWMFDAFTASEYNGKVYYNVEKEVRRPDGRTETKTVTEYRHVSGDRTDNFFNVSIPAGDKVDMKTYSKLEPFNISNIKVYSPEFLAGYYSTNYTIDLPTSWRSACNYMDLQIKNNIVRYYNADGYVKLNLNTRYSNTKYCYTLFPVWICTYMFNEKVFNVFLNGTNGKITGKAPISGIKVFFFVLFLILLTFGLIYLGSKISASAY